jgi:phage gp29-like protein
MKPAKPPQAQNGHPLSRGGAKVAETPVASAARRQSAARQTPKIANREAASAGPADAALAGNPAALAFAPDASTAIITAAGLDASGSVSLTRRLAAISRWRDFYDPLAGFNVARARALSEDYTRGWMADLQWTYFFLEGTDPDLFALVDRRTSRLLEMDYTVKLAKKATDDDDPKAKKPAPAPNSEILSPLRALAGEQEDFLREKLEKIDNLYEAIEHLAMASFRGYAHCEKWHGDDGEINHLEIVDQWNVIRDGLRGGWKYNPRAWQSGYFALSPDLVIDPANFLSREVRRHINRIALLKFTSKKLAEVDWDAFGEIYGIPSGVITGPPAVPQGKEEEFRAAAEEISQGGSGYLPYGSLYTKNDMPRAGAPFKERLEFLTEKLILVGTGGMLTMIAKSGSGTLAGSAHTDAFEQIAKGEARKISETINKQLVKPWLEAGFPGQPQLAYFDLSAQEETKLGEIVAHIATLKTAGYQVDADEVCERTGYTVTLVPNAPAGKPQAAGGLDGKNSDPATGDPASIANRALVDAGRAVFDRHAQRRLTTAQTEAVLPLLDRIAALKELPADQFAAGLQALRRDLPRLFAEARLHTPDIAAVWEQVLGTALVDGLADLPSK